MDLRQELDTVHKKKDTCKHSAHESNVLIHAHENFKHRVPLLFFNSRQLIEYDIGEDTNTKFINRVC